MKHGSALALGLCLLASGCVTNPNRFEYEGGWVNYEMLEVSSGTHKLTLEGASGQNKTQVERAYAFRASQLCDGKGVASDPEYIRSSYYGPALDLGLTRRGGGYRLSGVVTCPAAHAARAANVAVFRDSAKAINERSADLFYLSKIDDQKIEDSNMRTERVNRGRGMLMGHEVVERNVPAQPATFTIEGRTRYAAPILRIAGNTRTVTGTVTFTPQQHKTYIVKGRLGADYSAVWIEEELEGGGSRMVGDKIENPGQAK